MPRDTTRASKVAGNNDEKYVRMHIRMHVERENAVRHDFFEGVTPNTGQPRGRKQTLARRLIRDNKKKNDKEGRTRMKCKIFGSRYFLENAPATPRRHQRATSNYNIPVTKPEAVHVSLNSLTSVPFINALRGIKRPGERGFRRQILICRFVRGIYI